MALVYFVPGRTVVNKETLSDNGLEYIHEDERPLAQRPGWRGSVCGVYFSPSWRLPGGYEGADYKHLSELRGDTTEVLIASVGDTTPPALSRRSQVSGIAVQLGDGHSWVVPTVRRFPTGTMLPQRLVLMDGEWCSAVFDKYLPLCDRVSKLWDEYTKAHEIDFGDFVQVACEALSVNYRVSAAEISILNLLNTENVQHDVFYALVDMEAAKRMVETSAKKKDG